MSVDHTTDDWHLTPGGWIAGTERFYGVARKTEEPPEDRVETWERDMKQSHAFAKEHVTWRRIWVSSNYTEDERTALLKKYPRPA